MSSLEDGWATGLSEWARAERDIQALVQIGSRVQAAGAADQWSDFDYQLVTSRPGKYLDGSFSTRLGRCWGYGAHVAFGNSTKVTAVYEGALEADFVILRHAEVLAALLAMRWPATARLWPSALRRGIAELRTVVGPGWRMIKGGAPWERRYSRIVPRGVTLTEVEFNGACGEFWTQIVWAAKRLERGEFRACQRCIHVHLVENCLRMLQEEARLDGRASQPLGRRAERWLGPAQLGATDIAIRPDKESLSAGLGRIAGVFADSSAAVAGQNGWTFRDYAELRAWLKGRLS